MEKLTLLQILFIHNRLIQETGGQAGIRDLGLLESSIARMEATFDGKDLYENIFLKTAALMESLCMNHPFVDGNKRAAITASVLFLRRNGYALEVSQENLESFTRSVASGQVKFPGIHDWFERHSEGGFIPGSRGRRGRGGRRR